MEQSTNTYRVHAFTEPGGHDVNEDALQYELHPQDRSCLVCAISDGQGGRAGGRAAAQAACQASMKKAFSFPPSELLLPSTWQSVLQDADRAVYQTPDAGFTTLVVACIHESYICGASSGDSSAIVRSGESDCELTSQQYKNPPVGSQGAEFVPFSAKLEQPWQVLMFTDGVWKYSGWENIYQDVKLRSGNELIESLQKPARLRGTGKFQDDFTIVAISPE